MKPVLIPMEGPRAGAPAATRARAAGSSRRRSPRCLLLSTLILARAGGPGSRALAGPCSTNGTTVVRVEDLAGVQELNSTVSCSGGGERSAVWAGAVVLDAPIVIGSGTFLSITAEEEEEEQEDQQAAEAQGGLGTRLFVVSAGGGLSLTGLKLSGGKATYGGTGGAIQSYNGSVTLEDCVFDGNEAGEAHGGAVSAEGGGRVTIIGGAFWNNAAGDNGGAVSVIEADLVIRGGTRFEGNVAVQGGALYTQEASSCSLQGAMFASNNATDQGGAWAHFLGDADVAACVFSGNWAQFSGGAVFGGAGTSLAVDGCVFRDNATPGEGGALSASSAIVRGGTELTRNSAGEDGGGVRKLVL